MRTTRRGILVAATLLAAGCTTGDPGTTTTTTTTSPTTTTTGAVTVQDVTVQPEVVALSSPDAISTSAGLSEQYVIATVTAATPTPDAAAFTVEAAGQSHAPDPDVGGMGGQLWPRREPYGDDADGWLAFTVPNPLETESATLTWPGGSHQLPTAALRTLARPPTNFAIQSFVAPEAIVTGQDATLTLEIENTGDADGTWVGALNRSGPSVAHTPETALVVDVPAGETVTQTYTNTAEDRYTDDGGEMEFRLTWRGGSQTRTVTVQA